MKYVMILFSVLLFAASFLVGALYFNGLFVASAVFFSGAAVVEAIHGMTPRPMASRPHPAPQTQQR